MPKMIGLMRLGRDAELRYTPNKEPVTNLSLAYAHGKAGQDGKRPTQWIDATLWGKRAEALTQYLTKGGLHCFTLDELNIQTFQKQDGSTGTKLVARVLDVELGSRQDAAPAAAPPRPPAQRRHRNGRHQRPRRVALRGPGLTTWMTTSRSNPPSNPTPKPPTRWLFHGAPHGISRLLHAPCGFECRGAKHS